MEEQAEGEERNETEMHPPDICLPSILRLPLRDAPLYHSQSMDGARVGLLSSSREGEHVIKAGPISILNCLGPRDWFRDAHV